MKTGIILSGAGNLDGSELQESIITMLHLSKNKAELTFMAPDYNFFVSDYLNKQDTNEERQILKEAARISRGNINNIKDMKASDFDAIIIPGGLGAIKNLSNFAQKKKDASIDYDVERILKEAFKEKKIIGAICISPVLLAIALKNQNIKITIGKDIAIASIIEELGNIHEECNADEICIDEENKIITTPAYMLADNIVDVEKGIKKLVEAVIAWH